MANLKTTYKDDVLNTTKNTKRKFNMITNSDGTVSFEDVTEYSQVGDSFGAADVNAITEACNELNSNKVSWGNNPDNLLMFAGSFTLNCVANEWITYDINSKIKNEGHVGWNKTCYVMITPFAMNTEVIVNYHYLTGLAYINSKGYTGEIEFEYIAFGNN